LHFFGTTLVLAYAASEPLLLVAATMAVVVGLNVYELTYMVRQKMGFGKIWHEKGRMISIYFFSYG
jgi:hypothetical protein